jgi:hypothetical protein
MISSIFCIMYLISVQLCILYLLRLLKCDYVSCIYTIGIAMRRACSVSIVIEQELTVLYQL